MARRGEWTRGDDILADRRRIPTTCHWMAALMPVLAGSSSRLRPSLGIVGNLSLMRSWCGFSPADFYATWCHACQRVYPLLCLLAEDRKLRDKVVFAKVRTSSPFSPYALALLRQRPRRWPDGNPKRRFLSLHPSSPFALFSRYRRCKSTSTRSW